MQMLDKSPEPYECIEIGLNNMFNEVNNDYSSIIAYFEGLYKTFSKFEQRSQTIKTYLDNTSIPDCFSSTVGIVTEVTANAAKNLFFESTFDAGFEQLKNTHQNYTSTMKDKMAAVSQLFQQKRVNIQNLVKLNESKNDQAICIKFHESLLEFMTEYKVFYDNASSIINQCIDLSRDSIRQIEDGIAITMSLLMGKFSLATDLEEVSIELESIIELQKCLKDTLNFNYIYQNYIVQKSLLNSKDVSFFALESVNRSNSRLKFSMKEPAKGCKRDNPPDLSSSNVPINQGQEGEVISFNGYSESWLASFYPQGQLYVRSDLLDVNLEK